MFFAQTKKELKEKFEISFELSKCIAEARDNKIIEGFISKAKEEYAFNDFYNNGNEDVLRYAGVVIGLENLGYPYFSTIDKKNAKKLKSIKKMVEELTSDNEEHMKIFKQYQLGAEYCLHDYIEEEMKYHKLDNRALFYEVLREGATLSASQNVSSNDYKRFQKLLLSGEVAMRRVIDVAKSLESNKYFQKNAYYAVKRFHWMHEKGTFDNMSRQELKNFYDEQVRIEKRNKFELENGSFRPNVDSGGEFASLSS